VAQNAPGVFTFSGGGAGGTVNSISAGSNIAVSTSPPNSASAPLVSFVPPGGTWEIPFNNTGNLVSDSNFTYTEPTGTVSAQIVQPYEYLDLATYPSGINAYNGTGFGLEGQVLTCLGLDSNANLAGVEWHSVVSGLNDVADVNGNIPFQSTVNPQLLVVNSFYGINPNANNSFNGGGGTYSGVMNVNNLNVNNVLDLTNTNYVVDGSNNSGTVGQVLTVASDGSVSWQTPSAPGGTVNSISAGTNIGVNNTNPAVPIVSLSVATSNS